MMLETGLKFLALTFVFSTDIERLPLFVYLSTGFVVLFGVLLVCKNIIKGISQKELTLYYVFLSASVILNLIFMKLFSRVELIAVDLLIIGTLMDIVLGAAMTVLSVQERRYVDIRMKSESIAQTQQIGETQKQMV